MAEKDKNTTNNDKVKKIDEPIKLKGRFISAVGKRKSAVARIRLYKKGNGIIIVNDNHANKYFTPDKLTIIKQPLKLTGNLRDLNISILIKGGGKKSQAEAIRHGIARALVDFDNNLKPNLKIKGWLSRDARSKERKKPGLKKARRAPQWSKR